ncbi:hypothetical protein FO519_005220 [Halicephalobus sp. NKZ332]|nr:hypothetical protein FO519_005220 [Halicephalobus sp. NKZ332]
MLAPEDYIYLDHNATTPILPEVVEEVQKNLLIHGNPSSSHEIGLKAKSALGGYRKLVSEAFGIKTDFVTFMSGGTEVNNTIIHMSVENYWEKVGEKPFVVTSEIEHPSILNPLKNLEKKGKLVIGRIPLQKPYSFDVITVTGHKFGGPAIAAMISTNSRVQSMLLNHPLLFGGGQEGGKRSGTENLPMIAGLSVAIDLALKSASDFDKVREVRDYLESQLLEKCPAKSFYSNSRRLPNTASITFPNMEITAGELLEECRGTFAASTGAACHADTVVYVEI